MKSTAIKSIFIICLLSTGVISCASQTDVNTASMAKTDNVTVTIDQAALPKKDAGTESEVPKKRAIGNALADKLKANAISADEDDAAVKKRIEDLETLVKEQKKLIDLYKEK